MLGIPNNWVSAFIICVSIGWVLNFVHWGIGMMVNIALLRNILAAAREKGYAIHAPALIACTYSTLIPGVGISTAAPLYGATPGYLATLCSTEAAVNYLEDVYPLVSSVLTWWNLSQSVILFLMILAVGYAIMPKKPELMLGCSDELYADVKNAEGMYIANPDKSTPAKWMDNCHWMNYLIGGVGLLYYLYVLLLGHILKAHQQNRVIPHTAEGTPQYGVP